MATKAATGIHVTRYLAGATLALGLVIGSAGIAYAAPADQWDIEQPCAATDTTCVNPDVSRIRIPMPNPLPPCAPAPVCPGPIIGK
jgi:hypothetical protein